MTGDRVDNTGDFVTVPHREVAAYHPAMTVSKWITAALSAMLAFPARANGHAPFGHWS